jgi:hypothetical protein
VPVVFLHGVGAGLLPYVGVAFQLVLTGRPLLLPVFKQVSMRLMKVRGAGGPAGALWGRGKEMEGAGIGMGTGGRGADAYHGRRGDGSDSGAVSYHCS